MAGSFDIQETFGACFVALLIAFLLHGITLVQTLTYYMRYPTDAPHLKILVAVVCVVNAFQTILITHGIYYYLVLNYLNPEALATGTWSFILEVVITDIIACIIQSYFAIQLYLLSKQWSLTATIMLLSITQAVTSLAFTISGFTVGGAFAKLQDQEMKGLLLAHLTTSLGADIIITTGLCSYLQASRTGYSKTERMISKLLVYAVNRGIFTGLSALLELVFYLAMPDNFIFIGIHFITSKLYTVSFMATLNIRRPSYSHGRLRSNTTTSHHRDISLGNMSSQPTAIVPKPAAPMIHITKGADVMTTASLYSQPSLIKEPSNFDTGETFVCSMGSDREVNV